MEKKLRKSPLAITLYVIAALTLVYVCYLAGSTVSQINEYYAAYQMSAKGSEYIIYILQSVYQPLIMAVLLFAAGKILNEVRALNPAYYATEDEIAQAKAAKKAAKADKAVKKGAEEVKEDAEKAVEETIVFGNKTEELKADMSMKKAELLEIAEKKGIEISDKASKAEILQAIEGK